MKNTRYPTPAKQLRSGFTTGSCAAAAARGAVQMLLRQADVAEVTIDLPAGISATFQLHGQSFSLNSASCFVIKDAGDDPDVTNGVQVWARVIVSPCDAAPPTDSRISITGGPGIGTVTKPGLAVPPGQPAINPVPLRMIQQAVTAVLSECELQTTNYNIEISIPDGEERAKKTLNARLGIIGGLSILGTTGIVRPISTKAWTDTVDAALDVAKACGCQNVVLSTGRSSEVAAQDFLTLNAAPCTFPEEAYIMMGDHVAYSLRACALRGFLQPIIACQFAKLLKIACGHENTHAAASELDLAVLRRWAQAAALSADSIATISQANTAREIAVVTGFNPALMQLVMDQARRAASVHVAGIAVGLLLCGYDGSVVVAQPGNPDPCSASF